MKIAPNAPSPTARRCWPLNFLAVTCMVVSDVSVARMSGAEAIGLPHFGQEAARFDTSFPHSTHLTSATSLPPVEPGPATVLVDGSAGLHQGRERRPTVRAASSMTASDAASSPTPVSFKGLSMRAPAVVQVTSAVPHRDLSLYSRSDGQIAHRRADRRSLLGLRGSRRLRGRPFRASAALQVTRAWTEGRSDCHWGTTPPVAVNVDAGLRSGSDGSGWHDGIDHRAASTRLGDAVRRRAVSLRPAGEREPMPDLDAQGRGGPTRSYTSSVPFAPRHTRRHESGFAAMRGAVNRWYAPGLTDASRWPIRKCSLARVRRMIDSARALSFGDISAVRLLRRPALATCPQRRYPWHPTWRRHPATHYRSSAFAALGATSARGNLAWRAGGDIRVAGTRNEHKGSS